MDRRDFLRTGTAALLSTGSDPAMQNRPPNVVLIYADDLGYGDVGCYGSPIRTPNIDSIGRHGVRLPHYYSASTVCSPSRAALMTGRYAVRVGVPRVLFPDDTIGLPLEETTMAEMLKRVGYISMCIGKWHLGSQPMFLPTNRGFDEYFGIPYSNDLSPLVLLRNTQVIEEPVQLDTLTQRYTEQAIDFIHRSVGSPFFVYFAHTFPHIPLASSIRFRGQSGLGPYGDAVEELDWSVGEVLQALADRDLDRHTLVLFTSDNGPWFQGSAGKLRGRKGETWDGGMRMPFLARFPGRIPRGHVVRGLATALDVLPTVARLANAPLPVNPLDGVDIWPMLTGEQKEVARDVFLFFEGWNAQCARFGRWKLHVSRNSSPAWAPSPQQGVVNLPLTQSELYNVESDPSESYDCSTDHPEIVMEIRTRMEVLLRTFPEPVQQAWRETMRRRVVHTPAGSLPVEEP